MENTFKVKFRPEIYKEIQRQIEEEGRSAIIRDEDRGNYQKYNPRFLQPPYFLVSNETTIDYAYKIIEPQSLRSYFINKNHVIPLNILSLDDSIFEWSE